MSPPIKVVRKKAWNNGHMSLSGINPKIRHGQHNTLDHKRSKTAVYSMFIVRQPRPSLRVSVYPILHQA
eukprot:297712-Amphidinium_carterae.1